MEKNYIVLIKVGKRCWSWMCIYNIFKVLESVFLGLFNFLIFYDKYLF